MTGMILTGHGGFATGLLSAVELLAGQPENLLAVDFTVDMDQEALEERILARIAEFDQPGRVLILADIVGGTPFKAAVKLSLEHDGITVVSGVSLSVLLQLAADSSGGGDIDDESLQAAVEGGKMALRVFDDLKKK